MKRTIEDIKADVAILCRLALGSLMDAGEMRISEHTHSLVIRFPSPKLGHRDFCILQESEMDNLPDGYPSIVRSRCADIWKRLKGETDAV